MLAWEESPVSDSVESEFDESEFEEDKELEGEEDESDEGESDDDDSGEDEYAEYESLWTTRTGVRSIRVVPIGTGRTYRCRSLDGTPRLSTLRHPKTGPVAQVVRAHA